MASAALAPDSAAPAARSAAGAGRYRYLLLLSHMRSYSSVLAHVLGSSPEVDGYGETHLRYRNRLGPWLLRREIRRSTGRPLRGPWLLDKVLHNSVRPLDRWVGTDDLRALIFLRRPGPALQSAMAQARRHPSADAFPDLQACCDHYVTRLHRLRQDGERLGLRALYFDAELLLERPDALLAALTAWLGLQVPLQTQYVLGERSGTARFGDLSPNLRAGRLLGAAQSTVRNLPLQDAAVLAEAQAAYQRCRAGLLQHCATLPVGLSAGCPAPVPGAPVRQAAQKKTSSSGDEEVA